MCAAYVMAGEYDLTLVSHSDLYNHSYFLELHPTKEIVSASDQTDLRR
jgi:hypothetical protein